MLRLQNEFRAISWHDWKVKEGREREKEREREREREREKERKKERKKERIPGRAGQTLFAVRFRFRLSFDYFEPFHLL